MFRTFYATAQRRAAFVETPARFRPSVEVLARLRHVAGSEGPSRGCAAATSLVGARSPSSVPGPGDTGRTAMTRRVEKLDLVNLVARRVNRDAETVEAIVD